MTNKNVELNQHYIQTIIFLKNSQQNFDSQNLYILYVFLNSEKIFCFTDSHVIGIKLGELLYVREDSEDVNLGFGNS